MATNTQDRPRYQIMRSIIGFAVGVDWRRIISIIIAMQIRGRKGDPNHDSNDWLDDGEAGQSSECTKYSPKSPRSNFLEKTQRIKKPKKQELKTNTKEEPRLEANSQSTEDLLVSEAVERLRISRSREGDTIPIYKKLTRERLLEFLQMIQFEYSHVVSLYLADRCGKDSCGSLKGLFLRFIDSIIAAFPVLNNIVFQYAFQYYASGPLQSRFNRLMDKNITPILKLMSEKYSKLQKPKLLQKHDLEASTHFSHSPERQHLEEFQIQDAKKIEKKKRKKNKKKECQEAGQEIAEETGDTPKKQVIITKPVKEEIDRNVLDLNNFLQNMCIDKDSRVQCRIDEQQLTRWKLSALKLKNKQTP